MKRFRLLLAQLLCPKGYYVESCDAFRIICDHWRLMLMGRSSAFEETKREMISQHGNPKWGECMWNWINLKCSETTKEYIEYTKNETEN